MNIGELLGGVSREVQEREHSGQPARAVILTRALDASAADLWEALTDPERISRWFMPVSGELRPGGRYQLQGNAGGEITACEPPRRLELSWRWQDDVSWVTVALEPLGPGHTRLRLEHLALVGDGQFWQRFGPGATGVGWEQGLLGLAMYALAPQSSTLQAEAADFLASAQGLACVRACAEGWGEAAAAAGEDQAQARAAAARTADFYTGEAVEEG